MAPPPPSSGGGQGAALGPLELFRAETDGENAPQVVAAALAPRAAIVAADKKRVIVVELEASNGQEERTAASFEVDEGVEKVAMSACGAYVALALASGAISLYKSSGQKLFSYPAVDLDSSDRIASIAFASGGQGSGCQDVLVATESGAIIRLGDLHLEDIEAALANEDSSEAALEQFVQQTQIQHFDVGRRKASSSTLILAHRFESSLVVFVANHNASISVWKLESEESSSFEHISSTSDDISWSITSMHLSHDMQSLAVLADGHLSWWNWSRMSRIPCFLDTDDVDSFIVGVNNSSSEAPLPVLAVVRNSSCSAKYSLEVSFPTLDGQEVKRTRRPRFDNSAALDLLQQTQDLTLLFLSNDGSHVFATHRCSKDVALIRWYCEVVPDTATEEGFVSDLTTDYTEVMQSLELTTVEAFSDEEQVYDFIQRIRMCIDKIGESSSQSRELTRVLTLVSDRIRRFAWPTDQDHFLKPLELQECGQDISTVLDRWTTFQLLCNLPDSDSARRDEWRRFRSASIVDMLRYTLQGGQIRAATVIWSRHRSEHVISEIRSLLDAIPCSLPVEVYQSWLEEDIIPALIRYVDGLGWSQTPTIGSELSNRSALLSSFASWVFERAVEAAMRSDFKMAIKLCRLLHRVSESHAGDMSKTAYFKFKLRAEGRMATSTQSSNSDSLDYIGEIEKLHRKLEHIIHLEEYHDFKISLSMFNDETPATIAMSMLDRSRTVDGTAYEIDSHVRPYLGFCNVQVDPVLCEYVVELAEAQQICAEEDMARTISVVAAISDVEVRVDAALALLRSVLPPYSSTVKQFAYNEVFSWSSQRHEELCEHIRMMKIQDMLLTYGVTRFNVADSRAASRLLSHILAQIDRPSAIQDAMLLVDAYSQLHCDRAVIQYSENLLSAPVNVFSVAQLTAEVQTRVGNLLVALQEAKNRCSKTSLMTVATIMDEVVGFGIGQLESIESERELYTSGDESAEMTSASTPLPSFVLAILEALVAGYLHELSSVRDVALSARNEPVVAFLDNAEFLPTAALLSDLRKLQRLESEHGVLLSVRTLRDTRKCERKLKELFRPEIMFETLTFPTVTSSATSNKARLGKRKKQQIAIQHDVRMDVKRSRHQENANWATVPSSTEDICTPETDHQRGTDEQATLLFKLSRFASAIGIPLDSFQFLLAQSAAQHGDIPHAARYARDMFVGRCFDFRASGRDSRPGSRRSSNETLPTPSLGDILKQIAVTISTFTGTHVEELYGGTTLDVSRAMLSRIRAPIVSLELLQYAVCVCDMETIDEILVLLKGANLIVDVLHMAQLSADTGDGYQASNWRIYQRWFRGDACILPSDQAIRLATSLAYEEHSNLTTNADCTDSTASKRFLSFIIEHHADLLSLQVILSLNTPPGVANEIVGSQTGRILSTVFQSQEIDNRFALGLMLTLDQKDAFKAFRAQISRENVSKDFNRFQQLALIGADVARAWQHIAFLHQCVELEGNARWMHYLNLLGIQCDHKPFQSDQRDVEYIRGLIPQLITRSSFDIYTVLEFTRHYQIDDNYPSLLYVEALLLEKDASLTGSNEYQDRIVGVLDDIHKDHLVTVLLKTLPKISGTDYERLLFVFGLLLGHSSPKQKREIERRIEVLHLLKGHRIAIKKDQDQDASENSSLSRTSTAPEESLVNFHELIDKPREILAAVLSEENYNLLASIAIPLRLEPDELEILLLKNMVQNRLRSVSIATADNQPNVTYGSTAMFSAFKPVLERLVNLESRITAAEWLAEHFPLCDEKVKALEFAMRAAKDDATGRENLKDQDHNNSTFTGTEAARRLEKKMLRVKIELMLQQETAKDPRLLKFLSDSQAVNSLLKLLKRPRDLFLEIYRRFALQCFHLSTQSLHEVADKVAEILGVSASKLRLQIVREWLILEAVYNPKTHGDRQGSVETKEDPFELLEIEKIELADEHYVERILYVAMRCVRDDVPGADDVLKFLVKFANETKPRAGVTFRAKVRALRVAFRLGQLGNSAVVSRYIEAAFGADKAYAGLLELLRYTTHCAHMVEFEEHRVPIELDYFLGCDKEALTLSLLRQFPSREPWLLRCVSRILLDFDVQNKKIWETVLSGMQGHGMFRSLSTVLTALSQQPFAKSLDNIADVWELVMKEPLNSLLRRLKKQKEIAGGSTTHAFNSPHNHESTFAGLPAQVINDGLATMVTLLKSCPFLERIDVSSFVVQLRDLSALADELAGPSRTRFPVDLYSVAVQCAMVIPSSSARVEALHRIVQAGAYMAVLHELRDVAYILNRDHLLLGDRTLREGTDSSEQMDRNFNVELQLVQAAFTEARRRHGSCAIRELLDSPFERGYIEFEAATSESIEPLIANLLSERRLEVASSAVELWYDLHPEIKRPSVVDDDSSSPLADDRIDGRWGVLKAFVAASSSPELDHFRSSEVRVRSRK